MTAPRGERDSCLGTHFKVKGYIGFQVREFRVQ